MSLRKNIEKMRDIGGFVGFTVDGAGVWYALFDVECAFWKFLNRDTMFKTTEKPLSSVSRYSYRYTTKIVELVKWLLEEHKTYLKKEVELAGTMDEIRKSAEEHNKKNEGKYKLPEGAIPCSVHKLSFTKECPETTNIKGLSVCPVCGFICK